MINLAKNKPLLGVSLVLGALALVGITMKFVGKPIIDNDLLKLIVVTGLAMAAGQAVKDRGDKAKK